MPGENLMDLERFRPFLMMLARILLEPRLRSYLDPSDLVQKTLMEAYKNRDQFQGKTDAEFKAWLKQILIHNLIDELRRINGNGLPRSLDEVLNTSTRRTGEWLEGSHTSPLSGAARKEKTVRLAEALAQLSEDQRTAIDLHHLQEYSLKETAERMGKSLGSVASLIHRGVQGLHNIMKGNSSDDGTH